MLYLIFRVMFEGINKLEEKLKDFFLEKNFIMLRLTFYIIWYFFLLFIELFLFLKILLYS